MESPPPLDVEGTGHVRKHLEDSLTTICQQNQRKRPKIDISADLICPITLELPWDPVTAEDGRVYEQAAIEQHITMNRLGQLRSPVTNKVMGRRLFPATQHKNVIDNLVTTGVISGDLAGKWKQKVQQKKDREDLLKKAESGDVEAMAIIANNYEHGLKGFQKDAEMAFRWFQKAETGGCIKSTAQVGIRLCLGSGVETFPPKGIMYLGIAAAKGSYIAALFLGIVFLEGWFGVRVDREEAIRWFQKTLDKSCAFKQLPQSAKEDVVKELLESGAFKYILDKHVSIHGQKQVDKLLGGDTT